MRTNLNFFGVQFFITAIWYLRIATVQIIQTSNPLVVTILSVFFLKEKFYIRYLVGIIVCFIGAIFIILNERKDNNEADKPKQIESEGGENLEVEEKKYGGSLWGFIWVILCCN